MEQQTQRLTKLESDYIMHLIKNDAFHQKQAFDYTFDLEELKELAAKLQGGK
jgi:hypothetical protein